MSRVQLALNVSDLDQAVAFYSKLFNARPAKVRPRYANFSIAEPPLKLVLIEGAGQPGSINHLGVEVGSPGAVLAAAASLSDQEIEARVEAQTTCCYAIQDKVWVDGPDGARWEVYTVLADADSFEDTARDGHSHTAEGELPTATSAGSASSCCS